VDVSRFFLHETCAFNYIFYLCKQINKASDMTTQAMTKVISDYFKTQPVSRAWIFGSFARGEETEESDIDILVEYDKNARISLLTISHMMGELEKSTGRRVDLIEEGCLLPFAVDSANHDKKLIYERKG
jgi:predicted nucleotidyltransferase